jgi:preprotein translocase subunit YajC
VTAIIASLVYQGAGGMEGWLGALPFVLIFVIFYFLLFLPTQRRQKKQKEMLGSLKTGDRVVTTGGIRGTIVNVKEDVLHLRVPPQDIRLEIVRSAVAAVEPAEKS